MTLLPRLSRVLEDSGFEYRIVPHRQSMGGPPLAKVIAIRDAKGDYLIAVLPESEEIDLGRLVYRTGREGLTVANASELERLFPDCESGAAPPFGVLYGVPMYVDACFRDDDFIAFHVGKGSEVVQMRFDDFARLARPFAGEFCMHPEHVHVRR